MNPDIRVVRFILDILANEMEVEPRCPRHDPNDIYDKICICFFHPRLQVKI